MNRSSFIIHRSSLREALESPFPLRGKGGDRGGAHESSLILLCAALATALPHASAQQYPTKPVRLIVPISAGGGLDTIARAVGQKMTESLGQAIVVDNRGGASGTIAAERSEAVGSTPQQLAIHIKAERARWAKVIKDAGIRGEE